MGDLKNRMMNRKKAKDQQVDEEDVADEQQ